MKWCEIREQMNLITIAMTEVTKHKMHGVRKFSSNEVRDHGKY